MPDLDQKSKPTGAIAPANDSAPPGLPASATATPVGYLGLAGFTVSLFLVRYLDLSPVAAILTVLAATALPMLAIDILVFKVHRRASTGLDWSRPPDFSLHRSLVKLLGLAATIAVLGLGYWLFPEYRGQQYAIVFDFFKVTAPYLVAATIIYVVVIDAYMAEPRDGYWQAGCIVIGRFSEADKIIIGQYCRGWLMKGFFIPFIISVFMSNIGSVFTSTLLKGEWGFGSFYDFVYPLSFALDTAFGALGYLLTLRLADTHLRSTEPTALGWLAALICYPPFWPFLYDSFLPYDAHAVYWGAWFGAITPLYWLWGIIIMVLLCVFAWSTMTFGCRFSNLTHRGILTNGPYRWCKHPAYVSKVLSYWLITLPFIASTGLGDAIRGCLMLALVGGIYFVRARTEERHLSRDPTYVAYALWMNDYGLLRGLGQAMPFFRYRAPDVAARAPQLGSSSVSQ
jgi:protein-S-isoprenylcysteine O-methyltransferase Ste14